MVSDGVESQDEYRELAELLEERLARPKSSGAGDTDEVRLRLIQLYVEKFGELDRAAVHVEELLSRDEVMSEVLDAASALLDEPAIAPRVAERLSDAYARLGRFASEASTLARELKLAAPPRLYQVQRRLSELKHREFDDPEGALELLEPLIDQDPGDEELRKRYIEISIALDQRLSAAQRLTSALGTTTNDSRASVGFDIGVLYLEEGELKHARGAFLDVVQSGSRANSVLSSARRLIDLEPEPGDPALIGPALQVLVALAPEAEERKHAAKRLLLLHERQPMGDAELAVAFRALIDSERADEALTWLASLYERTGDEQNLSEVRRQQALRAPETPAELPRVEEPLEQGEELQDRLARNERHSMTMRKALELARQNRESALELCRELLEEPTLEAAIIEAIADLAHDEDEPELHHRALELLTNVSDEDVKKRALERLGDFQYERLGDQRAAAESWRPAAEMCEHDPAEEEHARQLYERVLEALPKDRDAAERLVRLYAHANEWFQIPKVFGVLIREKNDPSGPVSLLLGLEEDAIKAGAVDEFFTMVIAALERIGADSPEQAHALKRASARALASDAARQDQASDAYRDLIESFRSDADIRQFDAFLESRPSAEDRHWDRRWLYEWRAAHLQNPVEVLREWAKAEEEYGDVEAAIVAYQRLAKIDSTRAEWHETVCRLTLHTGDFEGTLAALRALREQSDEKTGRAVELRTARLLVEELGRPAEAVEALADLLGVRPKIREAHDMAQKLLRDEATRSEVAERLEQFANRASDVAALPIFELLVGAHAETKTMPERRRRWIERHVELTKEPAAAFSTALRGALELPGALSLWDAAERLARELGKADVVAKAYRDALVKNVVEPELAEALGLRLIALHDEHALKTSGLPQALERVLELAPRARSALDRIKLLFSAEARWDELLRLYDRAIATAPNDQQLAELLEEAALTAKDLANDFDRATHYLEILNRLRPDDTSVDAALERLYERHAHPPSKLIELLGRRAEKASGFALRELRRRIATLLVEAGQADQATAVVEHMLVEHATLAELCPLLEAILLLRASSARAQRRAIELLGKHYEALGSTDDIVRITEGRLALSEDAQERARCVRELVRLGLDAAHAEPGRFAQALKSIESWALGDPALAKIGYETLLLRALRVLKRAEPVDRADAASAALQAMKALTGLLVALGKPARAVGLLQHLSRLAFEPGVRRELLRDAALLCSERLQDGARAIRIFQELFQEDAGDHVASQCLACFAALLESAGLRSDLAKLWEERARVAEMAHDLGEERGAWERAARLWEHEADFERAIAAHRRGAALGSESCLQALAQIHSGRGEWHEAAEALELLHAKSSPDARSALALSLAAAYVELGQRDLARARLEAALQTATDTNQVGEQLIVLYRQDGMFELLARQLSAQAKRSDDPKTKLALIREASELLLEKLDEPDEARVLLELGVAIEPRDSALQLRFAETLSRLGRRDAATSVLRQHIESYREHRSKDRALAHHALARLLMASALSKEALPELRLAAEMHPTDPAILYDLGRVALHENELEISESAYGTLILALHHPAPEPQLAPDRAEVYLDLSEVAVRKGDADRARDLVDSALDAAQELGRDPSRFEQALKERGRYDLLARAIERRVESPATLAAGAIALGDLVGLWSEHLDRRIELQNRIVHHCERIGRELELEVVTDAEAWAALASVHSAFADEGSRIAALRRRVEVLWQAAKKADPSQATAWLLEAAGLSSELGDLERALEIYESVFERDPSHPKLWPLLEAVLTKLGRRDRLIPLLEAMTARVPEGDRGRLRKNLARILSEESQIDRAMEALVLVLDQDPRDSEAAELLSNMLERADRFDDLVAVLYRRLSLLASEADAPVFMEAALQLGQVLEGGGLATEALPVYESILDWDPRDPELLRKLVGHLKRLGSGRLADCLECLIAADTSAAPTLARGLVELRDKQGDPAGVLRALDAAFFATPTDRGFRDRLVKIYEERKDWAELARVLRKAAETTPSDRALFRRLLAAYQAGGDDSEALGLLDTAIAARPRDAELLNLRAQSREKTGDDAGALSDLEAASAIGGRYVDALVELLEKIVGRSTPEAAERHTLRVVEVLLRAKRPEQTHKELERLLARSPNHRAGLEKLSSLASAAGDWVTAGKAYARLIPLVKTESGELLRITLALGDACVRTEHPGDAREPLERALAANPENAELVAMLERIYEASRDFTRLADSLVARAEQQQNSTYKTLLLLRAAKFLLEGAHDLPRALRTIEQARSTSPESLEALVLWAKAQLSLGLPHDVLLVLRQALKANRAKRSPLLAHVHLEIGKAHLALDELFEALDALKAAFNIDRRNGEVATLLGLVALDLDDEKTAERALSTVTLLPLQKQASGEGVDYETQATAFYHLASMAHAKGDLTKARRMASKASALDPTHEPAKLLQRAQ